MSRFDSTIFRSRRRVAGATAAVAAGVVAAVATPALTSGGGVATAEMSNTTTSGHHISYKPDPHGLGVEHVYVPKKAAPKPAATKAKTTTTNGTERASRSTSRRSLPSSGGPYSGSPKAIAQTMLAQRGWSGQFSCLNSLWNKESGWSVSAANPSGAYGIPQALPGSKMASAGSDWQTNPATQIRWGLNYISSTYGTPCAAWAHSQANNWY
jgi:hypothetical protein